MALCFRCKVDTEVVELKKWEITLSHEGISRRLTFEVEVFPAEVQEAGPLDHKYVNWLSCRGIADYHNAPLFSQGWYDMFEKYLRLGSMAGRILRCSLWNFTLNYVTACRS